MSHAPHVAAAIAQGLGRPPAGQARLAWPALSVVQPRVAATEHAGGGSDFVTYGDLKAPTTPPPPPRFPVYALTVADGRCVLRDVKTGCIREPGTLFAGFVRMEKGGQVYLSPRPAVEIKGDSHPTIAAATPEGQRGAKKLVAAGEIGIVDNVLIGHNDKTGHYRTRKNLRQSGLPAELFHPFTEDPKEWFGKRRGR